MNFRSGMQLAGEQYPVYRDLPVSEIIFDITLLFTAGFKVNALQGQRLNFFLIIRRDTMCDIK